MRRGDNEGATMNGRQGRGNNEGAVMRRGDNEWGSFHVKSSDFWPFFHGPPPILLKFGTLVELV